MTQKDGHRDGERERVRYGERGEAGGERRGRAGGRGERGGAMLEDKGGKDGGLKERPHMEREGDTQVHHQPSPAPHHPSTGALRSSETPKDIAPMKSFRDVLSQSHTSTLSRRSTSPGFRLLWEGWKQSEEPKPWLPTSFYPRHWRFSQL